MKDARKKRKAKKRDLSDAMIVKSAVVMPPYRTENIIPEVHLTTQREFNSNASDTIKNKRASKKNQLANSRVSKLNQRNLSRLDDHEEEDKVASSDRLEFSEHLKRLTKDMQKTTVDWKQRFDTQMKPIYVQEHLATTTPHRTTWKTTAGSRAMYH